MAQLKLSTDQWLALGKKMGYIKESQARHKVIFSLPEESGLHEEDFEKIMKEKDPFIDIQEGGTSWMDNIVGDKDHPHEPAEPGDTDCPCGCGGGPECECWKQDEPCDAGKVIDKLNLDLGEHSNKETKEKKSEKIDRDSIHELLDRVMDIK
jgi:hypothetical protein